MRISMRSVLGRFWWILGGFFLFFCLGRTQKSNSEPPENEHMPLKKDGCKMHFPCKHGSFPWEKSFMFRAGVQVWFLGHELGGLEPFHSGGTWRSFVIRLFFFFSKDVSSFQKLARICSLCSRAFQVHPLCFFPLVSSPQNITDQNFAIQRDLWFQKWSFCSSSKMRKNSGSSNASSPPVFIRICTRRVYEGRSCPSVAPMP